MDVRNFLESSGHTAAVAGALAILAGVAFQAALGHDRDHGASVTRLAAARAVLEGNPAPALEEPDYSATKDAWSAASVAAPAGCRAFVATPRPRIVANVIQRSSRPAPEKHDLHDPSAPEAVAGPGHISLRWALPPRVAGDASVSEIVVWRRAAGDKDFSRAATLKAGSTSWDDESVRPRQSCDYRIQFRTADPLAQRTESASSPSVAATCPSGVEIRFTGGAAGLAANIVIRKWIDGDWAEYTAGVRPRDAEAGLDGAIGGMEVSSGKRTDFTTGFVLLGVNRAIRHFSVPYEERHLVGGVIVVTIMRREITRETLRIEFLDDEGKTRKMWKEEPPPAGAEPLTDDDR